MAVLKGQGADARDALGNLSAPWLLLSFIAGASCTRVRVAAVVGLAAALSALVAFYVAESVVLDLGRHSWLTDLELTARAGRIYYTDALVSGPLLGALGGLWAKRRSTLAAVAVALSFAFEPLAVWLYERRLGDTGAGQLMHYPWLWVSEVAFGLAAAVAVLAPRMRSR